MLEFTEPARVDGSTVRADQVRELILSGQPFIIEEAGNEAFQRAAAGFGLDRFRSVFGDRPWRVQCCERGSFEPDVPFADQTEVMPFSELLEKVQHPDERLQHYLNVWPAPGLEFSEELFTELRELGPELALTRYGSQELRVFWLGGKGTVTPLHYDTYARSHGVIEGHKLFILFPPDLRHYLKLKPFPLWSPVGWYSRIAGGPIDVEKFPQLEGTRPVKALCGPGDFLYLPPCWWHHVSIPEETTISISATFTPRRAYLYWYHWRLRLSRWLGGQTGVIAKLRGGGPKASTQT